MSASKLIPTLALCAFLTSGLTPIPVYANDLSLFSEKLPEIGLLLRKDEAMLIEEGAEKADKRTLTIRDIVSLYKQKEYSAIYSDTLSFARSDDPVAQQILGLMHRLGQSIEKDNTRAAYWLTKAANKGQPLAQHHLGFMYYSGEGVIKDSVISLKWLTLAMDHYKPGSERKRAGLDRKSIEEQLSKHEHKRAKNFVDEWYYTYKNNDKVTP